MASHALRFLLFGNAKQHQRFEDDDLITLNSGTFFVIVPIIISQLLLYSTAMLRWKTVATLMRKIYTWPINSLMT